MARLAVLLILSCACFFGETYGRQLKQDFGATLAVLHQDTKQDPKQETDKLLETATTGHFYHPGTLSSHKQTRVPRYKLLVAVRSERGHIARRRAVRDTWLSLLSDDDAKDVLLKFVVPECPESDGNQSGPPLSLQQPTGRGERDDDSFEEDVVPIPGMCDSAVDSARALFKWAKGLDTLNYDYLLKAEDDTFIRMEVVLSLLRNRSPELVALVPPREEEEEAGLPLRSPTTEQEGKTAGGSGEEEQGDMVFNDESNLKSDADGGSQPDHPDSNSNSNSSSNNHVRRLMTQEPSGDKGGEGGESTQQEDQAKPVEEGGGEALQLSHPPIVFSGSGDVVLPSPDPLFWGSLSLKPATSVDRLQTGEAADVDVGADREVKVGAEVGSAAALYVEPGAYVMSQGVVSVLASLPPGAGHLAPGSEGHVVAAWASYALAMIGGETSSTGTGTGTPSFDFSPRHDHRWSMGACDADMLAQLHVAGDVMRDMAVDMATGGTGCGVKRGGDNEMVGTSTTGVEGGAGGREESSSYDYVKSVSPVVLFIVVMVALILLSWWTLSYCRGGGGSRCRGWLFRRCDKWSPLPFWNASSRGEMKSK